MQTHFGNYDPSSFGWTIHPTGDQIKPYSYNGVEFPQGINATPGFDVVLTAILDELVPLIPGGLVSGWCWGGDYSDPTSNSFHEYFIAVDLNAPANPKWAGDQPFGDQFVLPADSGDIFRKYGWEWGGNFSKSNPPDYMHGECHISPADIAALAATITANKGDNTVTPEDIAAIATAVKTDVLASIADLKTFVHTEHDQTQMEIRADFAQQGALLVKEIRADTGRPATSKPSAAHAAVEPAFTPDDVVDEPAGSDFPLTDGTVFGKVDVNSELLSADDIVDGAGDDDTNRNRADITRIQGVVHVTETGVYNDETYTAVKGWQAVNGLPNNGVVDAPTWDKMGL